MPPGSLVVRSVPALNPSLAPIEVVERKGIGHPDTICDALAEEVSLMLCRFYLERFGRILHHNVDKVLLVGGTSRPRFGGGDIVDPIEIFLAGRATHTFHGEQVPVGDLAREACSAWLRSHLRIDVDRHVHIIPLIRPGSSDLNSLFARSTHAILANDTSCGAGFAPLSDLERIVLSVEHALNSPATKEQQPATGEDVKVMGVRQGSRVDLTIGCAIIDRYTAHADDYAAHKAQILRIALDAARAQTHLDVHGTVNAADDAATGALFLTVSGTSAESGDDGEAGRGNRASGLITPYRIMTMEAAAGKNPVNHVGKLYQLAAADIAARLTSELADITVAQCLLVSQIGQPITDPLIADIAIGDSVDPLSVHSEVAGIVVDTLNNTERLTRELLSRTRSVF